MTTRREIVLVLAFACLGPVALAQQDSTALRTWSAPPYWLPSGAIPTGTTPGGEVSETAGEPAGVRALPLVAMAPCRLFDARSADVPALIPGVAQEIAVVGRCGIPPQAQGVSVRLAVGQSGWSGAVSLAAPWEAVAGVGGLILEAGQAGSTAGVVGLDASGKLAIETSAGSPRLTVDVNGYYAAEPTVRSLNGLAGDIVLRAGENVAVTSGGNTLTVAAGLGDRPATDMSAESTKPAPAHSPSGPAQVPVRAPVPRPRLKKVLPEQPATVRVRAQALTPPPSSLYVAGALELPNTNGVGAGSLTLGGTPFLHNYASPGSEASNTFVGLGAGNFTMAWVTNHWEASYNTAIGCRSLQAATTGAFNTAAGFETLSSNTTGFANTANGYQSLHLNTTGYSNTANGYQSLYSNTTGTYNAANGGLSLNGNTTGINNTASGFYSLYANTTGSGNTADGEESLSSNTIGNNNTAIGFDALLKNSSGNLNTAIGHASLFSNTTASQNTASGYASLNQNSTGYGNTANGVNSLLFNTTGFNNTAIGTNSLGSNTTGSYNIGIGNIAGNGLTTGSWNIDIGNQGVAAEGNTIRIGDSNQSRTFIAGIRGVTTANANAIPVLIDSAGQLGTVSSSRRFKKDIRDMGGASSRLLDLRPVTFRYIGQSTGIHFGLVAEEVAEVLPELVVNDGAGQAETVAYHEMPAMLINELKKQKVQIESQNAKIEELQRLVQMLIDQRLGEERGAVRGK